jgi:hypothetical protein
MIKIDDKKSEPVKLTAAKIDSDAALFELMRKTSRCRGDPDRPGYFLWDDPLQTEPVLLAAAQWQTVVDMLDALTVRRSDESSELPQDEAIPPKLPALMPLKDAQWRPIKTSLAAVDKDADQLTVPTIQGEPLLRDALPWIAETCNVDARLEKQTPSPKQVAAETQKTLTVAKALLERLSDPTNYDLFIPMWRGMLSPESQALPGLLPPLKGLTAELEFRLGLFEKLSGPGSSRNARKVRNQFWRELTRLWLSFNPNSGKLKRRHLQRFLFACSKPFFPDVADTKVAAFVDHYFQDQQTNT